MHIESLKKGKQVQKKHFLCAKTYCTQGTKILLLTHVQMSTSDSTQTPILNPGEETVLTPESNDNVATKEEVSTATSEETITLHESVAAFMEMTREELVKKMEALSRQDNIQEIKSSVGYIRQAFTKKTEDLQREIENKISAEEETAEVSTEEDSLKDKFYEFYNVYREKRKAYLANKEKEMADNLGKKKLILEELKQLIESEETLKKTYDEFNTIQEKWKEIGQVPRSEVNDLWKNYHFLVEQFFNKVKINKELRDLDLKRNLDAKISLCEKAEELILNENVLDTFGLVLQYQEEWREIGPVPSDKNEEIWERFRTACGKIHKKRQEYYETLLAEQEENLLAKNGLCGKMEELLDHARKNEKTWKDATQEVNDLFSLWKTIGGVPRSKNTEVWNRFKGAMDTFYKERNNFFIKQKEEQNANLAAKTTLCEQAEIIAKRDDWKEATNEILKLQAEWKTIGFVNKKYADKLWKRFRTACNEFFERKNAALSESREQAKLNKAAKEQLIEEVKAFEFGENKEENLNAIKDFQRRWSEIGFVPAADRKRLQEIFREAIDAHFEKLNISIKERKIKNFQQNIDKIHTRQGNAGLKSVKNSIQNEIQRLENEITLWENNLGFFAKSKQAELLKEEFESRIQKNKEKIAMLLAKQKMVKEKATEEKNSAPEQSVETEK